MCIRWVENVDWSACVKNSLFILPSDVTRLFIEHCKKKACVEKNKAHNSNWQKTGVVYNDITDNQKGLWDAF